MASTVARAQDFWRLAAQAERNGIRILVEPISQDHFATSATDPTIVYRVTGLSCSCKGFMAWQRCQHHALLLAELGWLPDPEPEPDPSPAAPTLPVPALLPCPDCDGTGRVTAFFGPDDDQGEIDCRTCGGAGEVESGARSLVSDEPDPWVEAPYDHGHSPKPARKAGGRFGLTDEELVILRGEAARLHAERGWPLVDFETGEILDPGGHRAA